jgi:hypothetical protein
VPRVPVACCWTDDRYFISYLKKPDNAVRWHDGAYLFGLITQQLFGPRLNCVG